MNYRLKKITLQKDCGMRVVFEWKKEEEQVFDHIDRMVFSHNGSILLQGKKEAYLLMDDRVVSAEHIVLHEAHPLAYTLQTGSLHVLFLEDKEIFRIDDPSVEGLALKAKQSGLCCIGTPLFGM